MFAQAMLGTGCGDGWGGIVGRGLVRKSLE